MSDYTYSWNLASQKPAPTPQCRGDIKTCVTCGQEFRQVNNIQKTCSPACQRARKAAREAKWHARHDNGRKR